MTQEEIYTQIHFTIQDCAENIYGDSEHLSRYGVATYVRDTNETITHYIDKLSELQTCSNCQFYDDRLDECYNSDSVAYSHHPVLPTDGCNKWKEKDK